MTHFVEFQPPRFQGLLLRGQAPSLQRNGPHDGAVGAVVLALPAGLLPPHRRQGFEVVQRQHEDAKLQRVFRLVQLVVPLSDLNDLVALKTQDNTSTSSRGNFFSIFSTINSFKCNFFAHLKLHEVHLRKTHRHPPPPFRHPHHS